MLFLLRARMSILRYRLKQFQRLAALSAAGFALGGAVVVVPPKEMLPRPLFRIRVAWESIGRILRSLYVSLVILVDYKWNLWGVDDQEQWNATHERCARRLVALADQNGGLYIKTGQTITALNHILPKEYCRTMSSLLDSAFQHPYSEIAAVVEDALGPMKNVFSEFSVIPLAAASVAQVHKARLKDGTAVAVKVQYIDIANRFQTDITVIKWMMKAAGWTFPGFDFGEIVRRAERVLNSELDFVEEAKNSARCSSLLHKEFGADYATTPTVHWHYTKRRVLVTDFVDGCRVNDLRGLAERRLSRKDVAALLISVFAHQIFCTGFVHADPHPGNVLVRKVKGHAQIVVLDHGLYATLNPDHRLTLANFWTAMSMHDNQRLESSARVLGVDDGTLLASMLLQQPYDMLSSLGVLSRASIDVATVKKLALAHMEKVTKTLELLPDEFPLVMRNLNTTRAIHKDLREPVNRTAQMLPYAIRGASLQPSKMYVRWVRWKLWVEECVFQAAMWYTRWTHPEVMRAIEEALQRD